MIYEFALEPELVATWGDRRLGRFFIGKFGLGQPRVVARYPKHWKKLVWEAFEGVRGDLERKRLEELIERLSEVMVKRRDWVWHPERAWLENAEAEHARVAFQAIIAQGNPRSHSVVLCGDEIDESLALWALRRGCTITREPSQMASAVASLLRLANVVVFVDPHFGPEKARYRRALEAFLRTLVGSRPAGPLSRLELTCSADHAAPNPFFHEECERQLPRLVPRGLRLRVLRLRSRAGGEQLHNRYILTDLGGVIFGAGLDDGDPGQTDDLAILDGEQYRARWQQYAGNPAAFDLEAAAIEVDGA